MSVRIEHQDLEATLWRNNWNK